MSKGGSTPSIPTYYAGFQMVLAHGPLDSVNEIQVSEKVIWDAGTPGGEIYIDSPEIFGGTSREGGIQGYVDIEMGLLSQTANPYLITQFGTSSIPAFRRVAQAVLKHVYLGTNYYFKPWWFKCTRIYNLVNGQPQWQPTLAEPAPGLINGIHVVREGLTNYMWGLGADVLDIDETSFLESAQTCYDEGLAFAWLWDREETIENLIGDVQKHVRGNLYRSRIDNKFYFKLVRPIPDTGTLLVLSPTNVKEVNNLKRKSLGELTYSVTVTFTNNDTNKDDAVTIADYALYQRQGGGGKTLTVPYNGVASRDVALKIASRDQWEASIPVYTCDIVCNRDAENLNIGDAFILDWDEYIENNLVMRVVSIKLGTATNQMISISAIEDFSRAATAVYDVTPPDTGWVDPINPPSIVINRMLTEVPYYMVATVKGDTFAQGIDPSESFIVVAGNKPTPDAFAAGLWTNAGGAYERHGVMDFCYGGDVASIINKTVGTITLTNVQNIELLTVGEFIQIDNEIMEVLLIISEGSFTVTRGVMDTVPEVHAAGARAFSWQSWYGTDDITYLIGETVNVKLTTVTPRGELSLASAPEDSILLTGRMHRPYPPGNLSINSSYWPASITTGSLNLVWAHRNRIQETTGFVGYYEGSVTTEPGVTYSYELIRTDTEAILHSGSGITDNFVTIVYSYIGEARLELWAMRDGLESWYRVTHTFSIS